MATPTTQLQMLSTKYTTNNNANKTNKKITSKVKGTTIPLLSELLTNLGPVPNNTSNIVKRVQSGDAYQRFEFNLMYLIDSKTSKKYYEAYTTYQMLLHSMDNLKYFMTLNRDQLYKMVPIREKIDMKTPVYKPKYIVDGDDAFNEFKKGVKAIFKGTMQDPSYLFDVSKEDMKKEKEKIGTQAIAASGTASGAAPSAVAGAATKLSEEYAKTFRSAVSKHFRRYRNNQSLFSFEEVGKSQIPVFQYLIKNYVENHDLRDMLLEISANYTQFKMKIINTLTDDSTSEMLFGLMTYGFLFGNKYFPKIHPADPNNIFLDVRLYDMAMQKVNVNEVSLALSKRIADIGDSLKSSLKYFYTGQYRDTILFEVIMTAMEMDLMGLQMLLYYAHPDYIRLFLKRKDYIDRQIENYVGSYNIENVSTSFQDIGIYKNFIDQKDGLFKSYEEYLGVPQTA